MSNVLPQTSAHGQTTVGQPTALYGHKIPSKGQSKSDIRLGQIVRKSQGSLLCSDALMIMIITLVTLFLLGHVWRKKHDWHSKTDITF